MYPLLPPPSPPSPLPPPPPLQNSKENTALDLMGSMFVCMCMYKGLNHHHTSLIFVLHRMLCCVALYLLLIFVVHLHSGYRSRLESKDTRLFCLRVMVGVIILYDHVDPVGAFQKKSAIDVSVFSV